MAIGLKFTAVTHPDAPIILNKIYSLEKADYLIATLADSLAKNRNARLDFVLTEDGKNLLVDEMTVDANYDGLYAYYARKIDAPEIRGDARAIRCLNLALDALDPDEAEESDGGGFHLELPRLHLPRFLQRKAAKPAAKPKKHRKEKTKTEPRPKRRRAPAKLVRPAEKKAQKPRGVRRPVPKQKEKPARPVLKKKKAPTPKRERQTRVRPFQPKAKIPANPVPPRVKAPITVTKKPKPAAPKPKPKTENKTAPAAEPAQPAAAVNPLDSPEYKKVIREIKAEQKKREADWRSHMDQEKEAYLKQVREEAFAQIRQASRDYAKSEKALQRDDKRQQKYLKRLEKRAPKSAYVPSPLKGLFKFFLTTAVYLAAFFAIYWFIDRFYDLPDMMQLLEKLEHARDDTL